MLRSLFESTLCPCQVEGRLTSINADCGIMTWQRTIVEWLLPRYIGVVWVDNVDCLPPRRRCQCGLVDLHVAGDGSEFSDEC